MPYDEEVVELVLARLETMPEHLQIHLGREGTVDKAKLIEHVKRQDALGKAFVQKQMEYIKSMAGV